MEPGSTSRPLVQKKTWRDSLPIDMLLSAVSVLVVAQSSSEIPEGLMNNPVLFLRDVCLITCIQLAQDRIRLRALVLLKPASKRWSHKSSAR